MDILIVLLPWGRVVVRNRSSAVDASVNQFTIPADDRRRKDIQLNRKAMYVWTKFKQMRCRRRRSIDINRKRENNHVSWHDCILNLTQLQMTYAENQSMSVFLLYDRIIATSIKFAFVLVFCLIYEWQKREKANQSWKTTVFFNRYFIFFVYLLCTQLFRDYFVNITWKRLSLKNRKTIICQIY